MPSESVLAPTAGPPNTEIRADFSLMLMPSGDLKKIVADGKAQGPDSLSDLRIAPTMFFVEVGGKQSIAVGNCQILTSESGKTQISSVVVEAWTVTKTQTGKAPRKSTSADKRANNASKHPMVTSIVESTPDIRSDISAAVENILRGLLDSCTAEKHLDRAPEIAKRLCELSRDNVAKIRDLRYGLESNLAKSSRNNSATEDYTNMVANLLQLNVICGRAADQAREAVREGLWVHIPDSPAYHAYRKLQDPSIVNAFEPANHDMRSWMRVHDAAIRQCQQMQLQLEAESTSIHALLSSASSISSSREADAQTRFNLLVGLVSIGLGVPALFLALYSATILLPLNSSSKIMSFLPVAIPLLIAALFALFMPPQGSTRKYWIGSGFVTLVVFGVLIVVAISAPISSP